MEDKVMHHYGKMKKVAVLDYSLCPFAQRPSCLGQQFRLITFCVRLFLPLLQR